MSRDFYILFLLFFAKNKDVLFLTIPRTLTKNPVPLHLQKQGTHSLFQKKNRLRRICGFYSSGNGG